MFTSADYPNLLVGLETSDDAAVYRISDDLAVVQTLDFFTPVVDDPYTYGAIAAANAMSDVYAMGGEVVLVLNIACFPAHLPPNVIAEIMRGGAEKVREAGGVVAGGHTVDDDEPKFGYINAAHSPRFRVYLNDVDVSNQCFEADDRLGYVGLYEMKPNGHIACPLREIYIYGKVRIERDV